MINFARLQREFHDYDSDRESLIKKSRDILKLSKQIIYSVHRDEMVEAKKLVSEIKTEKRKLDQIAQRRRKLIYEGSYKVAIQEYVEAILYYHFVKTGELIDIKVTPVYFVLGLADLSGELIRKAVFLAGKGKISKVEMIKDKVDFIYGELLKFDFRDNEMRRKMDAVKYDLRKLEDLVLDLKLNKR